MKVIKNYDVSPELEKEVKVVLEKGQEKYLIVKDIVLENTSFDASKLFEDEEE